MRQPSIFFCLGIALSGLLASCNRAGSSDPTVKPDSSRYTRTVLAEGLDEPMEMVILPGNDVLFVERKGGVRLYKDATKELRTVANFEVFSGIEDGLLGVVADPDFEKNHWLYFYYAVAGDSAKNRLSRMEFRNDSLYRSTERIILEIPTQRIYCCHSAGYLKFDRHGNLYLSTGDNTNAEETEGYTPVDERPGHELADDQATAANTNDLRGKILRIKPLPAGGYMIPEGNLYAPGTPETRPEIYAMGMRNPYRFSIDQETGYLYFGDVGPDTKVRGTDGELMSYDEINQVREPGFFGWPYFLGNNDVFPKYNYETKEEEPGKDPNRPLNGSPNNTGLTELPPAQPAMIWYNKGKSARFPLVGSGGATAMAGPVFYSKHFKGAPFKLSDYYDGKLFIYEWIRGWIMAVAFDETGNYAGMEPFLSHWKFDAPIDMQFAPDGAIYILEYGTNWFSKNSNARLIRIEYTEGNRNPIAEIKMNGQYGAAPFTVTFSAEGTMDHDGNDGLRYRWRIDGNDYEGFEATHTFTENGTHEVTLTVTDPDGGIGTATRRVYVGNTPPEVAIRTSANRSFYWDGATVPYEVEVRDAEEAIDPSRIAIAFGYIPDGRDAAVVLASGGDASTYRFLKGQALVASLDCRSCHAVDQESVGPTYQAIAQRYAGKPGVRELLVDKIIEGGSGNWGERAMSPHPDLPRADAQEMVDYILSLGTEEKRLPLSGTLELTDHIGQREGGAYLLSASYRDGGAGGIGSLVGHDHLLLRYPIIQAEDFDEGNVSIATITTAFMAYTNGIKHSSYISFDDVDLRGVKRIGLRVQASGAGGMIVVRQGNSDGAVVGSVSIPPGQAKSHDEGWKEYMVRVPDNLGRNRLHIGFQRTVDTDNYLFHVDWLKFYNH
ncbi:cytochrome c [Parapedobacter composti]|uniref:Cytochrome c n=1 Tax=Parapedobacter composti TaxID=623281 RepID=A0A1I1KJG6_9SPHI|nr:PQQ-dependent sugar dehydrogenase [Parapedobacter composti]SFC58818.1 cytochrome c [Parapedobacter composti]